MKTFWVSLLVLLFAIPGSMNGQNLPEQQCPGAIPVCQSVYNQANSYTGHGTTQELNSSNTGCLSSNEKNDVWYVINVSTSGNLAFIINPNNNSDDYDFALWNVTGSGCQGIYNGLNPIRCNFAPQSGNGNTGLSSTNTGTQWQPVLAVTAGQTYILNVSNYSSSQSGYSLDFSTSTASIFDNLAPRFVSASVPCTADTVNVVMSEPIKCSSLAANGSDFTLTPTVPGVSIVSASSPVCSTTNSASVTYRIRLSGALPNGTYTLKAKNGTDNNTLFDNCANSQAVGDSVAFIVNNPLPPAFNLVSPATCTQKAVFTLTPSPTGTYGVVIRSGTTPVRSLTGVTGAITDSANAGSYIATFTNSAGCSNTVAFTLAAPPAISVTTTSTNNCSGTASGTATATATGGTGSYTYSWNTTPIQTTATATNLAAGTYTVTVKDSFNCTATKTVTIVSYPAISLTTIKTDAGCHGSTNGTATASPVNGTAPYSYNWNTTPSQTTATATGLAAGTYTVTVTDANGCTQTAQVVINQPAAINASATATAVNCNGGSNGSATVTATGGVGAFTFNWSATPAQTTATATGLSAGTYTVSVTDANGCTQTASATVTQPTTLTATTTATNAGCNGGATATATVTETGGTGPYTYSWNTTPAQTTVTATGLSAGTYTVSVTDANGCTQNAQAIISQPTPLVATTTATSATCNGTATGTATVTTSGGTAPYTYSWNTTPAQTTATATNLAPGTYTVTITDANGCTQTASATVTQPTILALTANTTPVSCNGNNNGTASVSVTGGTGPYIYSWNTTPAQTTATATGLSAGTYTVSVTDANGCTKTASATVTQPTILALTVNTTPVSCNGNNNGTASVSVTGGTGPYTYSWNTTPAQTTATATNLAPGTYTATITDGKGCTKTAQALITQPSPFALTATKTDVSCNGEFTGTATAIPSGGTGPFTYSWNTTPAQTTATATGLAAGTYSVQVTDGRGCAAQATISINQPPALVLNTSLISDACAGVASGEVRVAATGGTGAYNYSWNTNPVQTTATATGLLPGIYTVTVRDALNCTQTETITVTTREAAIVNAGNDRTLCPGDSTHLTTTGNGINWQWTSGNIGTLSCTQCAVPIAKPNTTSTYTVTVQNAAGCKASDTITLTVPVRQPVSAGMASTLCLGDSLSLFASGGDAYEWSPAQSLSSATVARPVAKPSETTTYRVIISQNQCFKDTLFQKITIVPRPTIQLPADFNGMSGAVIPLNAVVTNAQSIQWTPATGLSCTDCANPTVTLSNPVTYLVTASTAGNCTATDTLNIGTACDGSHIFVANTFTPNGDGLDDWFFVQGSNVGTIKRMAIFNRWGEQLFEAHDFQANDKFAGWNGTYKGVTLSPDVFGYVIEIFCADGTPVYLKGDINLIR